MFQAHSIDHDIEPRSATDCVLPCLWRWITPALHVPRGTPRSYNEMHDVFSDKPSTHFLEVIDSVLITAFLLGESALQSSRNGA